MSVPPLLLKALPLISVALISSCGAPPPPPAPAAPPPTWSQLTSGDLKSPKELGGQLTFELWLAQQDQPSVELIEQRLSSSSVLADVNGSELSYQVSIGELSCELSWSVPSAELRAARAQRCPPQLQSDQAVQLAQAGGLIQVRCSALNVSQALDAHKVASAAARDQKALMLLPDAGLCRAPGKPKSFSVRDFVQVTALAQGPERALCSQGARGLSQPEVCLLPVDKDRAEVAKEAILSIIDGGLRGEPLREGSEVSRGPATGVLVSADQFKAQLGMRPQEGSLVVVNPKAVASDAKAQRAIMMRFTIP